MSAVTISSFHVKILTWLVGRVKNVSKIVLKNPLAFCAAILCILMEYLAKKRLSNSFCWWEIDVKMGPIHRKVKISHRSNIGMWCVNPEAMHYGVNRMESFLQWKYVSLSRIYTPECMTVI